MNIITTEEIEELPIPTLEGTVGRIEKAKPLGRAPDKPNIPQLDKEIMAIHSNMGTDQQSLADIFGVSQASVSLFERGLTQTNIDTRKENTELKRVGENAKQSAMNIAEAKLLKSLEIYDPDALEQKELPGAASKLASVYEKLAGNRQNNGTVLNFTVYQPRPKTEADFGDIIILENERK